jgi:magnesium-transporting ATPase (P-type)
MQIIVMFLLQFAGQICSVVIFQETDPEYYRKYGGLDYSRERYI